MTNHYLKKLIILNIASSWIIYLCEQILHFVCNMCKVLELFKAIITGLFFLKWTSKCIFVYFIDNVSK